MSAETIAAIRDVLAHDQPDARSIKNRGVAVLLAAYDELRESLVLTLAEVDLARSDGYTQGIRDASAGRQS